MKVKIPNAHGALLVPFPQAFRIFDPLKRSLKEKMATDGFIAPAFGQGRKVRTAKGILLPNGKDLLG